MHRIIKIAGVVASTGYSKSSIYEKAGRGEFPNRVKLGPNSSGWIEEEVNSWLQARITERDAAPAQNQPAAPSRSKA